MRDINDVVSNERLEKLSEYDCADRYEVMSMAAELLALRKERGRAEPVVVPDCFLNAVSALESLYRNGQKQCWHERYTTDMAYASGVLNACRAAMLQQSSGALQLPKEITNIPSIEPDWLDPTLREPGIYAFGVNECIAWMRQDGPANQPPSFPQWIPCSERMPEEHEELWVYTRDGCINSAVSWSGYNWYWDDHVYSQKEWGVTHWMPMVAPQPPQEPTK